MEKGSPRGLHDSFPRSALERRGDAPRPVHSTPGTRSVRRCVPTQSVGTRCATGRATGWVSRDRAAVQFEEDVFEVHVLDRDIRLPA